MRRLLALTLLISSLACGCAAGLAAPAALAAGSQGTTSLTSPTSSTQPSFGLSSGGAATTPQVQTVTPVTSTSSSSGGLSGLDGVIIAVVAFFLLGGIAFWIWYDSRSHAARAAHAGREESMFGQRAHAGSKAPRKQRKLTAAERKRRKRGRAR